MNKRLLLLLSLPLLFLNPILAPYTAHAITYTPGVQPNQFVDLGQISETSNSTIPRADNILANFSSIKTQVQSVNGNNVNTVLTFTFTNGSASRSAVYSGNVQTGAGNLTFLIISGGLSAGDPVYQTPLPGQAQLGRINYTTTRAYASALRSVNVLNETVISSGAFYVKIAFYWDATTGFVLELFESALVPSTTSGSAVKFSVDAKVTSTNVWGPSTQPDFGFDASPIAPTNVSPGGSLNYALNLTSFQGFSGLVSLSKSLTNSSIVHAPTLVLAALTVNVPANGFATTTLTFSTDPSTPLGFYLFSVHAASGGSFHDDHFAVYVRTNSTSATLRISDAYVANSGSNTVSVISGTTSTVIATVSVGKNPQGVAFDSSNNDVYVTNSKSNTTSVISATSNAVIATINVGGFPNSVVFDSTNGDLYVANGASLSLSVINGTTNAVVATVPVGGGPWGLAFDPSNNNVYGAIYSENTTVIISATTNTVVGSVAVGKFPNSVTFDPSNNDIYVANSGSNSVTVIDVRTNSVVATIPIGNPTVGIIPDSIAFDPVNNNIYVTDVNANTVAVIRGSTNTVVGRVSVGSIPIGLAIDPVNNRLYVCNAGSGSVSVINGITDTVVATVAVGGGPEGVAAASTLSGLVHYWPAEGNAVDVVGGDNGTLINGAGFAQGPVGQAFNFTGAGQYVQTLNRVPFGSADFTIDLWANFNAVPGSSATNPCCAMIADDPGPVLQDKWWFAVGGGILFFHINGPSVNCNGAATCPLAPYPFSPNLHQWYNLAVTRKGGNITIYVNAVKVSSQITSYMSNPTVPLTIGFAEAGSGYFNGLIDEVRIYNRALPAPEILSTYVAAKATPSITSALTPSSITIGGSASDLATLTGGSTPTGTVTYTVYKDSACTAGANFTDTKPLGTASASFTPHVTGTFYWIASYSGDANNNAVSTACGAAGETLTVSPPPIDYTLSISPTGATIAAGSSTTATITVKLTSGTPQMVTLTGIITPFPSVCLGTPSPCGRIVLSPDPVTPSASGATSTLTIMSTTLVPPGVYTIKFTGSPIGQSSASATFTITITAAPSVSTLSCGHNQSCSVQSNSTLSNFKLAGNTIHIEADGPKGALGYANVTIPKSEVPHIETLHVFIDNQKLDSSAVTITSNSTDYFVYFTFTFHSPVSIDIVLTAIENAPNLILGVNPTLFYEISGSLAAVIILSVIIVDRRRGKTMPAK